MAEVQLIDIEKIQQTHETQAREKIDKDHVRDIAEAMKAGAVVKPVDLFLDETGKYWIGDGHHRIEAALSNKSKQIRSYVQNGDKRAAILHAVGANAEHHALKRSNDDKRRAVKILLEDPEWAKWSNAEIARRCAVSEPMVAKYKKPHSKSLELETDNDARIYTTKHGTKTTMDTSNIGRKKTDDEADQWDADNEDQRDEEILQEAGMLPDDNDDEPDWMKEGESASPEASQPAETETMPVDPGSLEAVQGDIDEAVKALRQCAKQWQDTLRIETKDEQTLVTRPWCGRFSAATAKQLRSYASELVTHTPLSGEPDNPYTKADEKNDKMKEKDRK